MLDRAGAGDPDTQRSSATRSHSSSVWPRRLQRMDVRVVQVAAIDVDRLEHFRKFTGAVAK